MVNSTKEKICKNKNRAFLWLLRWNRECLKSSFFLWLQIMGYLTHITYLLIYYICESLSDPKNTPWRTTTHSFLYLLSTHRIKKKTLFIQSLSLLSLEMGLEYIYIMEKLDVIDLWVVAELESLFIKFYPSMSY